MKIDKKKEVGREIWKSLEPETRMLLLGLGLVTEPGEFGELAAVDLKLVDDAVRGEIRR